MRRATLLQDAPSYVDRQADKDLYVGLTSGEFCYVLTSRQKGKPSLMNQSRDSEASLGMSVPPFMRKP